MPAKTIKILYRLSKNEYDAFLSYLKANRTSEPILKLVLHLKKGHPDLTHNSLDKKKMYKASYVTDSFNESKLNRLLSATLTKFKEYLVFRNYANSKDKQDLLYLESVIELGLHTPLLDQSNIDMSPKKIDLLKESELEVGYKTDLLHSVLFNADFIHENKDYPLQNADDQLSAHFILQKLIIGSEMLNRSDIYQVKYVPSFMPSILKQLSDPKSKFLDNIYIRIYYYIYMLFEKEHDETWLNRIYETIDQSADQIEKHVLYETFAKIRNYCIDKTLKGDDAYWIIGFKNYLKQIELNLLIKNNQLSDLGLKNILSFALRSGEIKWAARFLEEHIKYIDSSRRENAYQCNYANILFYKEDYEGALTALSLVQMNSTFYSLYTRAVTIKALYQLRELAAFQSAILSFRNYLYRNDLLSKKQIEYQKNFVNLIHKLFKLEFQSPTLTKKTLKKKLDELEEEIATKENLLNRSWLLSSIEIFRSRKKLF